jgi:hypothetical protein
MLKTSINITFHNLHRFAPFGGLVCAEFNNPAGRSGPIKRLNYPFIPVVAMPSMKVFCAIKNSTITGTITSTLAAIN